MINIGDQPASDFNDPLGVLSDCHRRIERFLQTLITVTEQAAGGALTNEQREAMHLALRYFAEAAPKHTADEEESLFPQLRACRQALLESARATLESLCHDHEIASAGHDEVAVLGRRWLADGHLSADETDRLASRLREIDAIYRRHIAMEDGELFPLARRVLPAEALRAIGDEMRRRRGLQPSVAA